MNRSLSGKVVLITGAARGIGAATARVLAARGARIALVGLEQGRLEALARELGAGHAAFACDVTDQASLERAVAGTVAALGGIDVVIANAGIANNGTVAVNPADALARTIEVNLTGVIRTVSATLPQVEARRGYYLFIASAAALLAMPGMAAYAASKIGVEHFASALALEVARRGISVGVAFPGWIDTDLVRDQMDDIPSFRATLKRLPWPLGSVTSVEACADALAGAVERRARRVYVPRALEPLGVVRTLLWSRIAQRALQWSTRELVPRFEAEVLALKRSFGRNSAR